MLSHPIFRGCADAPPARQPRRYNAHRHGSTSNLAPVSYPLTTFRNDLLTAADSLQAAAFPGTEQKATVPPWRGELEQDVEIAGEAPASVAEEEAVGRVPGVVVEGFGVEVVAQVVAGYREAHGVLGID